LTAQTPQHEIENPSREKYLLLERALGINTSKEMCLALEASRLYHNR
jgi:hypothetical protein